MEPSHFSSLYPDDTRFEVLKKVTDYVKSGAACQIVAFPGVGRSNILEMLAYNRAIRQRHFGENQGWFHFVLINFAEIRKRPLVDVTKFIFLNLVDSLRERKKDEEYVLAQAIFKESVDFDDELVLFQGLKRTVDLLAIEKQLTIVFLFDRFEEYVPMLTPEFFSNLRVLRNRAKYRFSVIFSLNRPLEDMLEPVQFVDFHEFLAGNTIYLPLFDKPGLTFRLSYLEKITEKKLDSEIVEQVLTLTGGHMKLTRLSAEALLATDSVILANPVRLSRPEHPESSARHPAHDAGSREKPTRSPIKSGMTTSGDTLAHFLLSQKSIRGALTEIWESLRPSEQDALYTTPVETKDDPYLLDTYLVNNGKITIPLFETYLHEKTHATMEKQAIKHPLIFDATTNEIKKGNIVISDDLTSSEFRLLRFFLQNTERVLEREEVITAVWQEAKSTAGVTDQALDQLVFRVRKKIEEDPNSPTHIQTVKGRGFRFLP